MAKAKKSSEETTSADTEIDKKTKEPKKKAATVKTPRKRKAATTQVDDYYGLLGVQEDAPTEAVKRGYIEKVKQYPPERYPEEFKKIRRAYDNLREPELRYQYNILRKYGETVEAVIEESKQCKRTLTGTRQVEKLLRRAVGMDPKHVKAHTLLAYVLIQMKNKEGFLQEFDILKTLTKPEGQIKLWAQKVSLLLQAHLEEEAFEELQILKQAHRYAIGEFWKLYLDVYGCNEKADQLLAEIAEQIAMITEACPEDIILYTAWINIADAVIEPTLVSKAVTLAKKFVKEFHTPEQVARIVAILLVEYEKCRDDEEMDVARKFLDIAITADKRNATVQEESRKLQTIERMLNEFERAFDDHRLFPLVLQECLGWFTDEFNLLVEEYEGMEQGLPFDIFQEIEEEMGSLDQAYVSGVIRMKKKYPTIYRHFQERLDKLFKEKTEGMNREERRSFRL